MLPPQITSRSSKVSQSPSLASTARRFCSYRSPQVLLTGLLFLCSVRLASSRVTGWHRNDLLAMACVAALVPFVEWIVHKVILHAKPRTIRSIRIDLGEGHRDHHRFPNEPARAVLRGPDAATFLGINIAIAVFVVLTFTAFIGGPALGPSLSSAVAAGLGLLHYEWSHYLFHSKYQPRTRYYARLKRNHRLHHWRNENYWLGITSNIGDRALRTLPATKSDVAKSPTTRTLGVDPCEVESVQRG